MDEDDLYRTTTQFRFWTYTTRALADLRINSNAQAAERVKEAISRTQKENEKLPSDEGTEVDFLTVEEEQKIVRWYCVKAMEFCDFSDFSKSVKATAVQLLKRFYLSTSPMTYHPKQIMLSAIYLATKIENHYINIDDFAKKIPKTTAEDILAPEFLLTQGLRFTFDVCHPFRALEGGLMELNAIGQGEYTPPAGPKADSSADIKKWVFSRLNIPTPEAYADRIKKVYNKIGEILTHGALLSDAYFHYTPAQIWIAALIAADQPLAEVYIHLMLNGTTSSVPTLLGTSAEQLKLKTHLENCAKLMTRESARESDEVEKAEVKRIDKKLYKCLNPEKRDLVGMNKAAKQDENGVKTKSIEENGADDAAAALGDMHVDKKRKLEREKAKLEDPFGDPIKR